MSDTLPSPSSSQIVCLQQEIDSELSRLEFEFSRARLDALPLVGDLEPTYEHSRRNAEAERGAAVFHGTLSYALVLRAELFTALVEADTEDQETCRAALVRLAAWSQAAIEKLDRKHGR